MLTPQETQEIFEVLRRLAAEGHSIVFISHKLYEVLEIADRITVIRRGRVVGERIPSETNEEDLAELMVGREVSLIADRGISHVGARTLQVEGLVVRDDRGQETVHGIDLDVAAGEILGIAGVAGNGQDELVEAIIGLRKPTAGRVVLDGVDLTGRNPRDVYAAGVAYVPADRHRFGLVLSFSIADNLVLTSYYRRPYARGILRNDAAISKMADERIAAFDVRTPSADAKAGDTVRRQPAEGGHRPRVRARPQAARARPADPRPRRGQHRVHPPTGRRQAGCGDGRAADLRGARRGPRAVGPDRGHLSRQARRHPRRTDGRQERDRRAHGDRRS